MSSENKHLPNDECVICFDKNTLHFTSCNHNVCKTCFDTIVKDNNKCPICRKDLIIKLEIDETNVHINTNVNHDSISLSYCMGIFLFILFFVIIPISGITGSIYIAKNDSNNKREEFYNKNKPCVCDVFDISNITIYCDEIIMISDFKPITDGIQYTRSNQTCFFDYIFKNLYFQIPSDVYSWNTGPIIMIVLSCIPFMLSFCLCCNLIQSFGD